MVFLVGAPRSGTNWLQRSLVAHPEIVGVPTETFLFSHGLAPLAERVQHAAPELRDLGTIYADRDEFADACRDLCDRLFGGLIDRLDPDAKRLVERTPHHARHLDLISDIYPDASVVHIIRDGRDVARSLVSQPWGPQTMGDAASEWRASILDARRARKPAQYIEVRYEELLANPGQHLRSLIESLGLNCSDSVLERMLAEAGAAYNTDMAMPAIKAEKWRELPSVRLREFDAVAGDLNVELGYPPSEGRTPRLRDAAGALRRKLPGIRARGAHRRLRSQRQLIRDLEMNQRTLRDLLEAVHSRDAPRLRAMLSPELQVRLFRGAGREDHRGRDGARALVGWLEQDPAWTGRLLRSDIHVGVPLCAAVNVYEAGDGSNAMRIFAISTRDGCITRLSVHAPPAAA